MAYQKQNQLLRKSWYLAETFFIQKSLTFGCKSAMKRESQKNSLELLFNRLKSNQNQMLRVIYEYKIEPSFKEIEEREEELKQLHKSEIEASAIKAGALGLQQSFLYISFRRVFGVDPKLLHKILRFRTQINDVPASRFIEALKSVGVVFKENAPSEPGEGIGGQLITLGLAFWLSINLQYPIDSVLAITLRLDTRIFSLCLAFFVGWSYYRMAKQSLVNYFVFVCSGKHQQLMECFWVLFPIIIEVAFMLQHTIDRIGYASSNNPFMWISAIAGSAIGPTTLAFWCRSLAPRVLEWRERYLMSPQEVYEMRVLKRQQRDAALEKELENTRQGITELQKATMCLQLIEKRKQEVKRELKYLVKCHVKTVADWQRAVKCALLDLP